MSPWASKSPTGPPLGDADTPMDRANRPARMIPRFTCPPSLMKVPGGESAESDSPLSPPGTNLRRGVCRNGGPQRCSTEVLTCCGRRDRGVRFECKRLHQFEVVHVDC